MYNQETNTPLSAKSNESFDNIPTTESSGKNGFSITAMVCGIVSLVLCCSGLLSVILGIVAISFGSISLKRNYAGRGMAIAGIVCGIISICIYILYLIYVGIAGISAVTLLS